jgi:FkbM family methyltransferase
MTVPAESEDEDRLKRSLMELGASDAARAAMMSLLRTLEASSEAPAHFRERVRWPLIEALVGLGGVHQITLQNGLLFDLGLDSRIERAALLSAVEVPEYLWEPQTTRLLVALSAGASHVVVGGAYIGDQVLPIARQLRDESPDGVVHAFEPMAVSHARLLRNIAINGLGNIQAHRHALWDVDDVALLLEGEPALTGAVAPEGGRVPAGNSVPSLTIDTYVRQKKLDRVGLIMLDTEGGEERALRGAGRLLSLPFPSAPNLVFEVHRHNVDWTHGLENTAVVTMLVRYGYRVFAVRDFHSTVEMNGQPIEVIPVDRVYLEGPPHGFNLLATKDPGLVGMLGLQIVSDVSPKYLFDKDPAIHHPVGGFMNERRGC